MKIRVGIVGYGNLGKAIEELLLVSQKFELVACFSRRTTKSKYNTKIEPYDQLLTYKNKIDILILCGSSKSDIENQAPYLAEHFCTINSFDTHKKIPKLLKQLDKISKNSKTISLCACGWDPGLFSIIRATLLAISDTEPYTFWGKGISMGHSDAIRQISGVDDGIEFTIPNVEAKKLAAKGKLGKDIPKHFRECYVVAGQGHKQIENKIKAIPHYFKDQPTTVEFVSKLKLLKLKGKLSHSGEIISNFTKSNHNSKICFKVQMQSNPHFTASIMISYITAIQNFKRKKKYGAFTTLSITPIDLFEPSLHNKIIEKFC